MMPDSTRPQENLSTGGLHHSHARQQQSLSLPVKAVVVADHTILRQGLSSLLQEFSEIKLCEAVSNLRQGLVCVQRHQPQILLVELTTDGTQSFDFVKQIKAECKHTQVIVLASMISDSLLDRGLKVGVSSFLTKFESVNSIVDAIFKVVSGERVFSPDVQKRLISRNTYDFESENIIPRRALLSPRELEVLCCVAKGLKAKIIGKKLHITAKTVERHKSNIMAKLGLHSQVDLAIYAIREGYVQA